MKNGTIVTLNRDVVTMTNSFKKGETLIVRGYQGSFPKLARPGEKIATLITHEEWLVPAPSQAVAEKTFAVLAIRALCAQ